MTKAETSDLLQYRIQADIEAFDGKLPERYAIAWSAYLAGLIEWGVIDPSVHDKLFDLLPKISEPNPVLGILLGREE